MDLMLKGKVSIVTGCGEGIGRRTALVLGGEGAKIVVNDIYPEKITKLVNELQAQGIEALGIKADVTREEEVNQLVKQTIDRFGKVDILVNNAGRGADWEHGGSPKSFVSTERKNWDYTISVCLYGTLNCTREVLPHMIERKYGKIISMISDAGRVGEPNQAAYSAAKGGIVAFSKALAKEVAGYNINVNCVSAAATRTERYIATFEKWKEQLDPKAFEERIQKMVRGYPLGRLGEPIDQARAVAFFASDCSNWVTGQTLSVNGGYSMVS
jgi:NAD(P)-dependent dehydrogenase (short-subunit alcohol dehydrogenase family)